MHPLVLALVLAGSPLTSNGVDEGFLKTESLSVVKDGLGGGYSASSFSSKPLKALNGKARSELVVAALTVVKAYLSSKDAHHAYGVSKAGQPPDDPNALIKQMQDEQAKSHAEFEEKLKDLPKDQQVTMRKGMAQMDKATADLIAQMKAKAPEATAKYQAQMTEYNQSADEAGKGLDAQVKSVLTQFLTETDKMPFDAKLQKDGRFADDTLEHKPMWWKSCWRAGKEPVDAARAFAKKWADELK